MHDVTRDPVTGYGPLAEERTVDVLLDRYGGFLAPFVAVVLLVGAWRVGEHSLQGFYLSIAAMVICGYPILRTALYSTLTNCKLNAEVLVVIALAASIGVGENVAGAMVALMMNIGQLLEDLTITKTGEAIRSLMELAPEQARVLRNGAEQMVAVERVRIGEIVAVRPGERIPVDGVVENGDSEVDQAAITGESMPVAKHHGDGVYGGTLNQLGALQIKVTQVGHDTTLAQMIALVHAAQADKPPIERIADRFAAGFTPAMLTLALVVWGITGELIRGVTVLVVACPCAMVIATPTAVVAGIGNAARKGILIKGGHVLEQIGQLTTLVFDKTGTLTQGRPQVEAVVGFDGQSTDTVLTLAACAEKHSGHPLAEAILARAHEQELKLVSPVSTQVIAGRGVIAHLTDQQIHVGNRDFFVEQGVPLDAAAETFVRESGEAGATAVLVGRRQKVIGGIAIADALRSEAVQTIQQLRQLAINQFIMLSGDSQPVAESLAAKVGMDAVFADLLPEQKLEHIRALKKRGARVAMVGDGINDAPSLAEADIGIAMGVMGTDAAIAAADIALTTDRLDRIAEAIALSRQTIITIKQSFFLSLIINVAALLLAATGGIGPIAGAVIHNIGAILVVGNSSRLIGYSYAIKNRDDFV
ncbi:MAG: heavy metal translocating P-type ATPase [Deltaproteobacteria bacterium]|nr:MAG: heavy metal translocating P-type ATPase [Deltaproteobacteria bacterium]